VAGVSIFWNLVSPLKIRGQVKSQQFIALAYQEEYNQVSTLLQDQVILADQRMQNMLEGVREVPSQFQAARDAYIQKSTLYKNGLTTIVDLQQALFALNRAETDLGVAYVNVWQALLQKAASSGDFELFIGQTK
jgi:outer membrane protein TolC